MENECLHLYGVHIRVYSELHDNALNVCGLIVVSVCAKMMEGAIMMIVDYHPTTYDSVQSYAHYLNVPTLVPGGTGSSAYDPYKYDISLLPPTIDAIVAVIKHFQWNKFVYYMFDTNDGKVNNE